MSAPVLTPVQLNALFTLHKCFFAERFRGGYWIAGKTKFADKTINSLHWHGYVTLRDEWKHMRARITRKGRARIEGEIHTLETEWAKRKNGNAKS